jgi:glycosyltransferase involved in cell wall biosynthesis
MADTIAFVESYPHVMAGQQQEMLALLQAPRMRGIDPIVIAPADGIFIEHVQKLGINTVIVPYPAGMSRYGGALYRDGLRGRSRTLFEWAGYTKRCRRELKDLRADALFCNDMRGLLTVGLAARSRGIPVMIWDKLDKPHGMLDWFQLPIVNRNLIISNSVMEKYPRWQRRWYKDRISRIPDGADLARIDRGKSIREELGIPRECIVIAIVGTVTYRKGHDRLLGLVPDLIESIPNARILVVGSYQDSAQDIEFYQSLENRNHPCVSFLGQRDRIEDIMHSIDILAIPSRHEGLGLVIVEAMAAGKPVVGANVGGIPEVIVNEQTGLIFEGDDRNELLQHLVRFSGDKDVRLRMGRAGRLRVEQHFDRSVLMNEVCDALHTLIKS